MANGFGLDSEQLQQSPQQQQLAAQQPTPAQGQGGGLLGFLGNLGTGLAEGLQNVGAYYQAARGNPALLQQLQAQEQQKNLLTQLQSISKQEMEGPFGGALSQALNMGDLSGAQKIVSNIPKYREFEKALPGLDLSEAERQSVKAIAALDPEVGTDLLKRIIGEKAVLGRQKEVVATTEAARTAREERKLARQEALLPENVLAEEITSGRLQPNDTAGMLGVLAGKNIRLSGTPAEQELELRRILAGPKLKKLIKPEDRTSIIQDFRNFIFGKPQVPAAPAAPQMPGAVRKFNKDTGRLE